MKYAILAGRTKCITPEEKAILDANRDGVVDRFDVHTIDSYVLLGEDGIRLFMPALSLVEENLDLIKDGVVNKADLDEYLAKRVAMTTGTSSYDSNKYDVKYDLNRDGSINDIDKKIFENIVEKDSSLVNFLKK